MKWLIWTITALVLLMWTLLIGIVAGVASWIAQHGAVVLPEMGQGIELMWPAWLTDYIPAVWLSPLKEGVEMVWTGFLTHWPAAATGLAHVVGWVSPIAWTLWGLVTGLCVLAAFGLHLLVARQELKTVLE